MTEPLSVKGLPVQIAKDIADVYSLKQVIIVAWDGKTEYVVTYGESADDSDQAAVGGNKVKKALGWPESLMAESPKVMALRTEIKQLQADVVALQAELNRRS